MRVVQERIWVNSHRCLFRWMWSSRMSGGIGMNLAEPVLPWTMRISESFSTMERTFSFAKKTSRFSSRLIDWLSPKVSKTSVTPKIFQSSSHSATSPRSSRDIPHPSPLHESNWTEANDDSLENWAEYFVLHCSLISLGSIDSCQHWRKRDRRTEVALTPIHSWSQTNKQRWENWLERDVLSTKMIFNLFGWESDLFFFSCLRPPWSSTFSFLFFSPISESSFNWSQSKRWARRWHLVFSIMRLLSCIILFVAMEQATVRVRVRVRVWGWRCVHKTILSYLRRSFRTGLLRWSSDKFRLYCAPNQFLKSNRNLWKSLTIQDRMEDI